MRYKFSDKEWKEIESKITIIVDTREKRNEHILDFFNKKNIPYVTKKLDYGDYSCMLPANSFEGQERELYFDRDIVIERKANIDELAGNLKDDAVRLKNELGAINKYGIRCILLLEDKNFDENIRAGNYRSQYNPNSLYNRLKKLIEIRYGVPIRPIGSEYTGSEIANTLKAYVYEVFKYNKF